MLRYNFSVRQCFVAFVLLLACAKVGAPPGKPELAGPAVRILWPSPGDTVSDTVKVLIEALDPSGVSRVLLVADGEEIGSDTGAPYQIAWATASLYDEPHWLLALAYDKWDNEGRSDTVRVFTLNGNEPPPDTGKKGTK